MLIPWKDNTGLVGERVENLLNSLKGCIQFFLTNRDPPLVSKRRVAAGILHFFRAYHQGVFEYTNVHVLALITYILHVYTCLCLPVPSQYYCAWGRTRIEIIVAKIHLTLNTCYFITDSKKCHRILNSREWETIN